MSTQITTVQAMFRTYLRPYWKWVALLILSYFGVSILTVVQPLIVAPVLDIVLATGGVSATEPLPAITSIADINLNNLGQYLFQWLERFQLSNWDVVLLLASAYLLVSLTLYGLNFAVYLIAIWIRVNSERDIQKDLFNHLLEHSLDFFHHKRTGELISRSEQDTRAVVSNLANIAQNSIVSTVLVLFYAALLIQTNFRLTTLILVAGFLHYALTQIIKNPIKDRVRDQFNIFAETTSFLQEILANIRVVKSFVAEAYEKSRLARLIQRLLVINLRFSIYKHVEEPVGQIINTITNVAILMLATAELFNGGLTISGFFLYLYIGRSILVPITDLGRTYTMVQTMLATSERVLSLFQERPKITSGPESIRTFRDSITFNKVRFRYGKGLVLEDVDFEVKRGEITALVGPSGAGKSTIVDLILRFYDPEQGGISIDGMDLRRVNLNSYRNLFGVVTQESLLFNDTVRSNITYPGLDLPMIEVEAAAKVANADQFIENLPLKYETLIGDRGVLLSGGQRQRLAIARAVVRKPEILLLDEATSSLDSESETLVQEAIDRVTVSTTAVIIAHRLSTIMNADKIVVINEGKIIDQGKHAELLSRCSLYIRLCDIQFGLKASELIKKP